MEKLQEWLNQNTLRKYPFIDSSVESILGQDSIVDFSIYIDNSFTLPLYLSSIMITPNIVAVMISDTNDIPVAIGSTVIDHSKDNFSCNINMVSNINVTGIIVLGPGIERLIQSNILGRFLFNRNQTSIIDSLVHINYNLGVKSIVVGNNIIRGDIRLASNDNILIEYDDVNEEIVISLKDPQDFVGKCYRELECHPERCVESICSINNVYPNSNGNINISGDGITIVSSETNTIVVDTPKVGIQDTCSNKTVGERGNPGLPGPKGLTGLPGLILCPGGDESCVYCDNENLDEC